MGSSKIIFFFGMSSHLSMEVGMLFGIGHFALFQYPVLCEVTRQNLHNLDVSLLVSSEVK